MALSAGARLGPYEIAAPIGAGGMGEVYRAHDTRLRRDVAIKVLPDVFANDPERLARFEREAHVLAALNHPHIAQVYGVELSEVQGGSEARALVMELVEGDTLADRLSAPVANGPVPITEALEIARQVADALAAAHERGIVHRDLKPANIKVRPDGTVKVLDFGLANWPAGAVASDPLNSPTITSPAMTMRGSIVGTAAYMSPEQAKGRQVDKRADIWSFGCVLFEMLSGKRLFGGDSVTEVLASVIKDPLDWSALPGDTPASVRRVLSRCLERDIKRRQQDIADARIDIEDAIAQLGHQPAHISPPTVAAPRMPRRELLAWGALLVLTAVVAVLAWRSSLIPSAAAPALARASLVHRGTRIFSAPEISPDGRQIVYTARNQDGLWQLWVRDLDALQPRALAGTESIDPFLMQPFWSPDSRSIGFFADGAIRRVPSSGGAVQALAEAELAYGGAWSSNGTILYAPEDTIGLVRTSADGGPATPVTTLPKDGVWVHMWPSFLPDGRRFLFTAKAWNRPFSESNAGIFLGSLDSPDTVRLLPDVSNAVYVEPGFVLFVRDGMLSAIPFDAAAGRISGEAVSLGERVTVNSTTQLAAFSVSRNNALVIRNAVPFDDAGQLQWIDRRSGAATNVGSVRSYYERTVSPDGRSIAATIADPKTGSADIWILSSDGTERRLTSSREYESAPVWSPDGTRIAYVTTMPGGWSAVHVRQVDGGEPVVLREWHEPGLLLPQSWSPDGRYLMTCRVSVPGRATELYTWSFDTKSLTPYLDSSAMECGAQFSPDGRYVAYVSTEAGPTETWVARFPVPAEKWRVATNAGTVSWRADGRELLVTTSAPDVAALPLTITPTRVFAGPPTTLVRRLDQIGAAATRDHSRLLVLSRPDPEQGVAEIQLLTGWLNRLR